MRRKKEAFIEVGESLLRTMERFNEAHARFIADLKKPVKRRKKTGGVLQFIAMNSSKMSASAKPGKFDKFLMEAFKTTKRRRK